MKQTIRCAILLALFLMLFGCSASKTEETTGTEAPVSEALVEYEMPLESIEGDIMIMETEFESCFEDPDDSVLVSSQEVAE